MKTRNGFVSNSSSTSFLIEWSKLSKDDQNTIVTELKDHGEDCFRCTGFIRPEDLEEWFSIVGMNYDTEIEQIEKYKKNGKNDLVLVRESDEGTEFSIKVDKIVEDHSVHEFEYH